MRHFLWLWWRMFRIGGGVLDGCANCEPRGRGHLIEPSWVVSVGVYEARRNLRSDRAPQVLASGGPPITQQLALQMVFYTVSNTSIFSNFQIELRDSKFRGVYLIIESVFGSSKYTIATINNDPC